MSIDPRSPVLVGAGVASQRCDDPREALEPWALMVAALEAGADDAGSRRLLREASSVRVPRGFWEYSDPGRLVAERLGATAATSHLYEIGVLQTTAINDACRAIAEGREEVALVTGADARYRTQSAKAAGIELADTPQAGVSPDETRRPEGALWADVEWKRGLNMPVRFFSVIENALRHADGLSIEAHRDRVAALWARMSRVAASNPHAWQREAVPADEIRNAGPRNRMIAFPYTRLHNSNWNVDQAAGLLLCSVEKARACGIPEERWVFPQAGTESNHMVAVAARAQIHRCPAIAVAGGRALELAGLDVAALDHVELYSCFPSAVQAFARELGLGLERPLTVTGGMAFAGGPLNNFVLQATARMAETLRADPGAAGLVTAVSGFLNKQGFCLWSTRPPEAGYRFEDLTRQAAAATEARELADDAEGAARVASYTVAYQGETPAEGIAVCELPDGRRTVASTRDPGLAAAMTREEFCGRAVRLGPEGRLLSAD